MVILLVLMCDKEMSNFNSPLCGDKGAVRNVDISCGCAANAKQTITKTKQ